MKRFVLFLMMTITCSCLCYGQLDIVGKSKEMYVKGKGCYYEVIKDKDGIYLQFFPVPYTLLLKHSNGKVDKFDNPDPRYVDKFDVTKIKVADIVKIRCVYPHREVDFTSVIENPLIVKEIVDYPIGEALAKQQSEAIQLYKNKKAKADGDDF